jgi:transcriptional regulator with XRE-family HTH domain
MSRKTGDDNKDWLGQSDPMQELGATIHALRVAAGLSQDQLAEKLNVSRAAVSSWETGEHTPRGKRLKLLASTLGVTVPDLMSGRAKATQRAIGSLIAVESDGSEVRVIEVKSVQPVLWAKTRQRVIVLEDAQGHRLGLLATDETIQALESCLLTLRELL